MTNPQEIERGPQSQQPPTPEKQGKPQREKRDQQQQGDKHDGLILSFAQVFAMLAFIAFMATSIPHVADTFAAWWPDTSETTILSFAVAIFIDGMGVVITFVIGVTARRRLHFLAVLPLYVLLLIPIGISTLANIIYGQHHYRVSMVTNTMVQSNKDIFTILFNSLTILAIIFSIAYDVIGRLKIVDTRTAEQKLTDMKSEQKLADERRKVFLHGVVGGTRDIIQAGVDIAKKAEEAPAQHSVLSPLKSQTPEQTHGGTAVSITPSSAPQQEKVTEQLPVTLLCAGWTRDKRTGVWSDATGQAWLVKSDARTHYALKSVLLDTVRTDTIEAIMVRFPEQFNMVVQGKNVIPVVRKYTRAKDINGLKDILEQLQREAKSALAESQKERTAGAQQEMSVALGD